MRDSDQAGKLFGCSNRDPFPGVQIKLELKQKRFDHIDRSHYSKILTLTRGKCTACLKILKNKLFVYSVFEVALFPKLHY